MGIPDELKLRQHVHLGDFTTWKVGGDAEYFAEPDSGEELQALVQWGQEQQLPLRFIGAGSNLLISDDGLPGLVVCIRRLQGSQLDRTTGIIEAQAGEPLPTLARRAAKAGLSGLEWSVGIPGTVGGAVVMNAGAQGGCIADSLIEATVLDPISGQLRQLKGSDLDYDYRHSRLQSEPLVVLSARFQLQSGGDPSELSARTSANLHKRTSTQPYQLPSCGSVFRNPEPQKAGRLIEALGLKGHRIGGAEVSTLHANFIVNTGDAQAADMDALIRHVQAVVQQAHGLQLHPEVMRLGCFANSQAAAA
jgi:UDP-N-acetylmuramate dehydrogenase